MPRYLRTTLPFIVASWVSPLLGAPASDIDIQNAWLAFASARGEASLIRGDVNHPTANDVFRIIPIPGEELLDEAKLQLGFDLFNDARLSRDGTVSCASCHIGMLGGVDRRPLPFGIDATQGVLNTPTIFNAALNFRQFWDGRALTLQEQALMPIENSAEMDHDLASVVATLKSIPEYQSAFDAHYADGITAANLGDAISYYETMNFTGLESPFLRQFEVDQDAINEQARRGQQRFVEVGCASCHNGINLGGNSYQKMGVASQYSTTAQAPNSTDQSDQGLIARTGRNDDRLVYKVPTLHNVAITGPWFHDGSVTTLQQAVDLMARHQSGRYLDNQDIDDIVAFLRTLHDSFALIGDCTATGNYGVTLDCDVKQRSAEVTTDTTLAQDQLPNSAELTRQHETEYALALEKVAAAPGKIQTEIQRIRTGEVAHFDFLQYEHIEMMRYARALSIPPATTEANQMEALQQQAKEWQETAAQLEITIADFLRKFAVANSAVLNYQDLLKKLAENSTEEIQLQLSQAEDSAFAFYSAPNQETQQNLERATQALLDYDLNAVLLDELQVQVGLMVDNLSG